MVLQFLRFSEYDTLDELLNLNNNQICNMVGSYRDFLYEINAPATVDSKLCAVVFFYQYNDVYISLYDI